DGQEDVDVTLPPASDHGPEARAPARRVPSLSRARRPAKARSREGVDSLAAPMTAPARGALIGAHPTRRLSMSHSMSRPVSTFAAAAAGLAIAVLALEYLIGTPEQDAVRQFLV